MADIRGAGGGGGGGGINSIIEDLTPQLGGHLDTNGKQVCWSQGIPVASPVGGVLTLGTDGNEFDITGANAITSIATLGVGTVVVLHFDGFLTLTHNAVNLILPGGANIATAAGDIAVFYEYAAIDWRCIAYTKANGEAVVGGGLSNIVEDLTPQLGGVLDTNGQQVGWSKGADVASASSLVLGTDGNEFDITGATTITSIATLGVGTVVVLHFDSNVALLHDPINFILPSAGNIAALAGDIATFYEYAAADWRCIAYTRANGEAISGTRGKQTSWIPAGAMVPTVSNGCAPLASVATTANRPDLSVLDFDASADEHAQFSVAFPKRWDVSFVTYQVFWTVSASSALGVAWALQGVAVSDNVAIDGFAYGTGIVVVDTAQSGAKELYVSGESGNVTIAQSPVDDDLVYFRLFRDVSDAGDLMIQDARLIGIKLFWTSDLENDD